MQALDAERDSARRTSRTMLATNVVLLAVVFTFIFSGWRHIDSSWTQEKFANSMTREMERLTPAAMDELAALSQALMPVYAHEARRQLELMSPRIERELGQQLEGFIQDVRDDAQTQLARTEARIREHTTQAVLLNFPELRDPEQRAAFVETFNQAADQAFAKSMRTITENFSDDVNALRDVIAELEVNDSGEPTIELQKRFVHLWLTLLDDELMRL